MYRDERNIRKKTTVQTRTEVPVKNGAQNVSLEKYLYIYQVWAEKIVHSKRMIDVSLDITAWKKLKLYSLYKNACTQSVSGRKGEKITYCTVEYFKYTIVIAIGLKKDWNHVRKCQKFAKPCCRPTFWYVVKTSADKVISQFFLHFLTWIQSFFKPIEFWGLKKVNWVEKRLTSGEKM